jgi:hypothetical protein
MDDFKNEETGLMIVKDMSIEQVRNMDFVVIKEKEMNEIAGFINNEHQFMLDNFSKSQSNFMDTMLVFNAPTTVRNLRQISAEIESKKGALLENQHKLRKAQIVLRKKIRDLELMKNDPESDPFDIELLEVDIEHSIANRDNAKSYIEAALKTILCMKQQYDTILKNKGITDVTELDFEKEEEEYHIKKSSQQAFEDILASGRISVGNNRYLLQLGIMPNLVHEFWIKFLTSPNAYDKKEFDKKHEELYQKLKGICVGEANKRGMEELFYENSCVRERIQLAK